ncbi:MAG: hypothetical protein GC171_13640 [Terrimonas sp.]|nr:hypothetical protein [Terrimonas sp.]
MKKNQWITAGGGIVLVIALFLFRDEIPPKKAIDNQQAANDDLSTEQVLEAARSSLSPGQLSQLLLLENSLKRGDIQGQKIDIYHQLSHFWRDSVRAFVPFAWYTAEAARLENSEKNLTFAAHLLLDSVRDESDVRLRKWEALQAKDLFERSLKINPNNDSSKVGLGSCYLFGGIAAMPMEGIRLIREVVEKDSTNIYGQMMLGYGSLISGQYEKAVDRFERVLSADKENMEALLMIVNIADEYEKEGKKENAAALYTKLLPLVKKEDWKVQLQQRIDELNK